MRKKKQKVNEKAVKAIREAIERKEYETFYEEGDSYERVTRRDGRKCMIIHQSNHFESYCEPGWAIRICGYYFVIYFTMADVGEGDWYVEEEPEDDPLDLGSEVPQELIDIFTALPEYEYPPMDGDEELAYFMKEDDNAKAAELIALLEKGDYTLALPKKEGEKVRITIGGLEFEGKPETFCWSWEQLNPEVYDFGEWGNDKLDHALSEFMKEKLKG